MHGVQVCVDGHFSGQPSGTGVSTHASELAAAVPRAGFGLQLLAEGDAAPARVLRWVHAATHLGACHVPAGPAGIRHVGDAFRLAQVHLDVRRRFLPLADRAAPPALMHWTYPVPLHFRDVPNVYTIHDLIPLLHPTLTGISRRRMTRLLGEVRRWASHIVTVSEASRQEIIGTLGWPADRVTNTYQAVADTPPGDSAIADILGRLGLQRDGYVLQAGSVEPRKNVRRLVESYWASGVRTPLVLAGPDGWQAAGELHGLTDTPGLRRLPWVDRPTMLALLCGARFVAAPSLAEGFGLTVAEAMALGTPVLTSDAGATAEVAGGAAMLVDPRDGQALTEAIRVLDTDPVLRARLSGLGRRRATVFSRDAYAERLRRLYSALVVPA